RPDRTRPRHEPKVGARASRSVADERAAGGPRRKRREGAAADAADPHGGNAALPRHILVVGTARIQPSSLSFFRVAAYGRAAPVRATESSYFLATSRRGDPACGPAALATRARWSEERTG